MPLNLVFCGTPRFAVPTLETLVEAGFRVKLVVTQPDRPKGRGTGTGALSGKAEARSNLGFPVIQPEKIKNNDEFQAQLPRSSPTRSSSSGTAASFRSGCSICRRCGNINLHASLLPKYRGAAPIQWAIANGETVTGVTTMRIDAGLDTGDILLQREWARLRRRHLRNARAPAGGDRGGTDGRDLARTAGGDISRARRTTRSATLAPILKKEDGRIDFSLTRSGRFYNRLRGFQPWPGAFTKFRGKPECLGGKTGGAEPSSREIAERWRSPARRLRRRCAGTGGSAARREEANGGS